MNLGISISGDLGVIKVPSLDKADGGTMDEPTLLMTGNQDSTVELSFTEID